MYIPSFAGEMLQSTKPLNQHLQGSSPPRAAKKPKPFAGRANLWADQRTLFILPADCMFLSSRGRAVTLPGQPEQTEAGTHQFLCGDQEDKRQTSEPQPASLAGPSDKGFLHSTS